MAGIIIGKKYGRLLILGTDGRDKFGHLRYRCICDCGEEIVTTSSALYKNPDVSCLRCAQKESGVKVRSFYRRKNQPFIGKSINGWAVLSEVKAEQGALLYNCRCERCGNVSAKSMGQIHSSKSPWCEKCTPQYSFQVENGIAKGILPDGSDFLIDADDIHRVNAYYWHRGKDGYIVASRARGRNIFLHRFLIGVTDSNLFVDHANRNRSDCRKSNLRVADAFQNSCNHSMHSTNKTGYMGVYYSRSSGKYEVKVGYGGRRILLGSSRADLIRLAQMYNIAAKFLFGEFIGHLNDVPDPPDDMVCRVIEKCKKYIKAPLEGAFLTEENHEYRNECSENPGGEAQTGEVQSQKGPETGRSCLRKDQTLVA